MTHQEHDLDQVAARCVSDEELDDTHFLDASPRYVYMATFLGWGGGARTPRCGALRHLGPWTKDERTPLDDYFAAPLRYCV